MSTVMKKRLKRRRILTELVVDTTQEDLPFYASFNLVVIILYLQ